jgi:hypothetical protein
VGREAQTATLVILGSLVPQSVNFFASTFEPNLSPLHTSKISRITAENPAVKRKRGRPAGQPPGHRILQAQEEMQNRTKDAVDLVFKAAKIAAAKGQRSLRVKCPSFLVAWMVWKSNNQNSTICSAICAEFGLHSHWSDSGGLGNMLGAEIYWLGLDELASIAWDLFRKVDASVRAPKYLNVTPLTRACSNPAGVSIDEIYRYFINKDVENDPNYVPADWHAIRTVMADNPDIEVEEYKKQFAGLPQHLVKAWRACVRRRLLYVHHEGVVGTLIIKRHSGASPSTFLVGNGLCATESSDQWQGHAGKRRGRNLSTPFLMFIEQRK